MGLEDIARAIAASASPALAWVLIGQPFDVIRTRLQATSSVRFRGPMHCFQATVRREGFFALYKGFLPQMLISLPYSAVLFGSYSRLLPIMTDEKQWKWQLRHGETKSARTAADLRYFSGIFLAGMGSGVLVTLFQNPLDVWRTRLQTAGTGVSGTVSKTEAFAARQLPRSALRGLSMTIIRNLPGNGIFFLVNELLREGFMRRDKGMLNQLSPAVRELAIGGITGIIFNFFLNPVEVLRSRMMATTEGGVAFHARRVVQEHGLLGFMRGAGVTTAKAFPVNAGGFALLFYTRRILCVDGKDSGSEEGEV